MILHGEYIGESEGPSTCEVGEHRYTRRIVDGFAEHDLILVNRLSQNFRRIFSVNVPRRARVVLSS